MMVNESEGKIPRAKRHGTMDMMDGRERRRRSREIERRRLIVILAEGILSISHQPVATTSWLPDAMLICLLVTALISEREKLELASNHLMITGLGSLRQDLKAK